MPTARKGSEADQTRRADGTGTVLAYVDARGRQRFKVGFRMANGKRKWKHLPPGTSAEAANERARAWSERERNEGRALRLSKIAKGEHVSGESLDTWFGRLVESRERRGVRWVKDDRSKYTNHIGNHACEDGGPLGSKPVETIQKREIERLVSALDAKIVGREISWKTAQNVWSTVATIFDEACSSKDLALRVREDNPTRDVKPPERGAHKAKTFLYPSEFLQLMTCERVPLHRRRLYAVAIYFYGRAAEIEALEWSTVDLKHATVRIHQAMDRLDPGEVKPTKAEEVRDLPIEPNLIPLLKALCKETGGKGRVIARHPHLSELASCLREDLRAAGCTRADLYANDDTRINIRYHDLRGTAATWMAIRGDSTTDIMENVGHTNFQTTLGYVRKGRRLAKQFGGEVFPVLPGCLLEPGSGSKPGSKMTNRAKNTATPTGIEPVLPT